MVIVKFGTKNVDKDKESNSRKEVIISECRTIKTSCYY